MHDCQAKVGSQAAYDIRTGCYASAIAVFTVAVIATIMLPSVAYANWALLLWMRGPGVQRHNCFIAMTAAAYA